MNIDAAHQCLGSPLLSSCPYWKLCNPENLVFISTKEGDEYGKKAQCKIKFNLDSSCEEMELNCDGFDMAKGSQMTVKVGKNKAKK